MYVCVVSESVSSSKNSYNVATASIKPSEVKIEVPVPETRPTPSKRGSEIIDSSVSRITGMFPASPSKLKYESAESPKPSYLGRVFSDEASEPLSKVSVKLPPTEPETTAATSAIIPETSPKVVSRDSVKVRSLADLQNSHRSPAERNSPKPTQKVSPNSSVDESYKPQSDQFVSVNAGQQLSIQELRQSHGLPSNVARRESVSNTLNFAAAAQIGDDKVSGMTYQENPLKGKSMKYDVDKFEDNPLHTRSPKYEVESFQENPLYQRSPKYEVETFEDNPLASQTPGSAELSKRRSLSSHQLLQRPSPQPQPIQSVAKPISDVVSSEIKQSSESVKTPTKKSQLRRSASVTTAQPVTLGNHSDLYRSQTSDRADEFDSIRKTVRPVTNGELDNALDILKYDLHKEIKVVVKEVVRQFEISRVRLLYKSDVARTY